MLYEAPLILYMRHLLCYIVRQLSSVILDEIFFSLELLLTLQRTLKLKLTTALKCAVKAHISIAE